MTWKAMALAAVLVISGACSTPPPPVAAPASVAPPTVASFIPPKSPSPTTAPKVLKTPQEIALTLADVPAGFKATTDNETTIDTLSSSRADPAASKAQLIEKGYVSGWFRQYRKDALFGLVIVNSSVGAYSSVDGAKYGLSTNVQTTTTATPPGVQISLGDAIGDESFGYQTDSTGTDGKTIFTTYAIYFRFANVSNSVSGVGQRGTIDISAIVDLARKQLARQKP